MSKPLLVGMLSNMVKNMVNIIIPLKYNTVPDQRVITGITTQSIACNYILGAACDEFTDHRAHIAHNRNMLKNMASYPVTFFMNSNVILTERDVLSRMRDCLLSHEEYDAVAVDTKQYKTAKLIGNESRGHVDTALFCIRYNKLMNITFRVENGCTCNALCRDCVLVYMDYLTHMTEI